MTRCPRLPGATREVTTLLALTMGMAACGWPDDRTPLAKRMGEGTLPPKQERTIRHDIVSMAAAHRALLENTPLTALERKRREWGLAFCTATLVAIDRQEYVLHPASEDFEGRFDESYATFEVEVYVDESGQQMALTLPFLKAANPWLETGGAPR